MHTQNEMHAGAGGVRSVKPCHIGAQGHGHEGLS